MASGLGGGWAVLHCGVLSTDSEDDFDDAERGAAAWPALRVVHCSTGPIAVGSCHRLPIGETWIGRERAPRNGLEFPGDRRMSRRHAALLVDRLGGVRLLDGGSRNGTFVSGRRVTESVIHDGEVIRIGETFFVLRREPDSGPDAPLPAIVGVSPAIRMLRHQLRVAAPSKVTVLLLGESGTGKEVAATALHAASGRTGPCVAVNCAAIPAELAESQLFGHVAGAFTGARQAHPGFFRAAHAGTLFLDEVGELSPPVQAKLLRAIEERAVIPTGATTAVPVDLRIVAATNRDLLRAVDEDRFRGDLYARLDEVRLHLPPLRDRREDILPLFALAMGDPPGRLTSRLVEALLLHRWPFNVRELFKVASQLRLHAGAASEFSLDAVADRLRDPGNPTIAAPHIAEVTPAAAAPPAPEPLPPPGREHLAALLEAHGGNISSLARAVGRSRRQVRRWLEEHRLDAPSARR